MNPVEPETRIFIYLTTLVEPADETKGPAVAVPPNPSFHPMEARGIEPRSDHQSEIASTCVGCVSCLPRPAHSQPTRGLSS